jgi:hypothetical protein
MTVKEMIEKLQKCPSDAKVYAMTQAGLCEADAHVPTYNSDEVHILGDVNRRVRK